MSKTGEAIRLAYFKGYRVSEDGTVSNASGKIRKVFIATRKQDDDKRAKFSIKIEGKSFPVPVHRLAAFQKFGEAMFETGILVRHLDEDSLNNRPDNLALGTHADNAMDRQPEARQLHAQKGNRGNGVIDEKTWDSIREDHENGMGYKKLRTKYGVGLSTLSYRLSKTSAYRLLENR